MESTAFFTTPLSAITSKWRIFYEESADLNPREERGDFQELRGMSDSRIYRHGEGVLAVSTESTRLYHMLQELPGVRVKNGGVLLFPDSLLDTVATVIRARYRRYVTPEQKAALLERLEKANLAPHTTDKGTQNRA